MYPAMPNYRAWLVGFKKRIKDDQFKLMIQAAF